MCKAEREQSGTDEGKAGRWPNEPDEGRLDDKSTAGLMSLNRIAALN